MKKAIIALIIALNIFVGVPAYASSVDTYTVVKGDSLWKIAVKYQVGLSEIIAANPQFKDPNLIYPGQKVYVPLNNQEVISYEEQVINLVNQVRAQNGLKSLTSNW